MVGHTHEDIDSVFGKIWKFIRTLNVLTPQDYLRVLMEALKERSYECNIVDVYAVPDYKAWLDPLLDPNFSL
jgi:hypothetical protein